LGSTREEFSTRSCGKAKFVVGGRRLREFGAPTPLSPSRPLLLGHRGASKYSRENTVTAFNLALEHGCDGFEFDVRYTSDFRAVICHNPFHRRRRIERHLFSEFKLPCADEVIRNFVSRAYLDIELKVPGQVQPILEMLRPVSRSRFVISSFLPDVLESVHSYARSIPLGLICENVRQLRRWPSLPIGAVMTHRRLVTRSLVDGLHSVGKQVFAWTVNRKREMLRLADLGIDGLISDDTLLLARTFDEK
jgi:glycerophosphoryl diester phosphodiesterase